MNKRILADTAAGELQRSLLASWDDERPSDDARARTLAALGIAAAPLVVPTVAATAAQKTALASLLLKWGAIGVVTVGTTAAAVGYATRPQPHAIASSPPRAAATSTATSTASATASATSNATSNATAVESRSGLRPDTPTLAPSASLRDARTSTSTERGRARSRAHATAAAPPPAPSLDAQLATLNRARQALAAGRPDSALASLDDYDARFPGGAFAQEAGVLRVQALVAQGDRAGAQRVAARFLAAYPQSPHAARVRTLVGDGP